jgi:hypothetical protein
MRIVNSSVFQRAFFTQSAELHDFLTVRAIEGASGWECTTPCHVRIQATLIRPIVSVLFVGDVSMFCRRERAALHSHGDSVNARGAGD